MLFDYIYFNYYKYALSSWLTKLQKKTFYIFLNYLLICGFCDQIRDFNIYSQHYVSEKWEHTFLGCLLCFKWHLLFHLRSWFAQLIVAVSSGQCWRTTTCGPDRSWPSIWPISGPLLILWMSTPLPWTRCCTGRVLDSGRSMWMGFQI